MMASMLTPPNVILGVTVYNPLPARSFVDLDHECVIPIGGSIDELDMESLTTDIDNIQDGGTLSNGVAWGITSRTNGFADILIDAVEVTEETVALLIKTGYVLRNN